MIQQIRHSQTIDCCKQKIQHPECSNNPHPFVTHRHQTGFPALYSSHGRTGEQTGRQAPRSHRDLFQKWFFVYIKVVGPPTRSFMTYKVRLAGMARGDCGKASLNLDFTRKGRTDSRQPSGESRRRVWKGKVPSFVRWIISKATGGAAKVALCRNFSPWTASCQITLNYL